MEHLLKLVVLPEWRCIYMHLNIKKLIIGFLFFAVFLHWILLLKITRKMKSLHTKDGARISWFSNGRFSISPVGQFLDFL